MSLLRKIQVCCADCTLCPWSINHFVAFTSIFNNLLKTSGSAALNCYELGSAWKQGFVFEIFQGEDRGGVYQPIETKVEFNDVNVWNSSTVAHEMKFVGCDGFSDENHLKNCLPAILRHTGERPANCLVPQLPSNTLEDGVRRWDWRKLELGGRGKLVLGESLASSGLFLRVILPLYIAFPAFSLFLNDK